MVSKDVQADDNTHLRAASFGLIRLVMILTLMNTPGSVISTEHSPTQPLQSDTTHAVLHDASTDFYSRHENSSRSFQLSVQKRDETIAPIFSEEVQPKVIPQYYINVHECSTESFIKFNGAEGNIHGFTNKHFFPNSAKSKLWTGPHTRGYNKTVKKKKKKKKTKKKKTKKKKHTFTSKFVCNFQVTVPEGLYIKAHSQIHCKDYLPCKSTSHVASLEPTFRTRLALWQCPCSRLVSSKSPLILTAGNVLFAKVYFDRFIKAGTLTDFWLYFKGITENLRESFNVVQQSDSSGYIAQHGFDQDLKSCGDVSLSYTLKLPLAHVLMLSFHTFNLGEQMTSHWRCAAIFLELYSLVNDGGQIQLWKKCKTENIDANIFNHSLVFKYTSSRYRPVPFSFKAVFSFHPSTEVPQRLPSGMFNCSRHYDKFRHHLDCNLRVECENQEDETEKCPFSSPQCKGVVHFKDRCMNYERFDEKKLVAKTWNSARTMCQRRGGELATFKTQEELDSVYDILKLGLESDCIYTGLHRVSFSTSFYTYRQTWRWPDDTTCYYCKLLPPKQNVFHSIYEDICALIDVNTPGIFYSTKSFYPRCGSFLCEIKLPPSQHPNPFSILNSTTNVITLKQEGFAECPGGHVVHDFLSCDVDSHCGVDQSPVHCALTNGGTIGDRDESKEDNIGDKTSSSVEMFQCHEYGGTIPYTLVCDFREDCADNSDEKYCKHKEDTASFRCNNGQRIPHGKVCDSIKDCFDGSEEEMCSNHLELHTFKIFREPPPAIVHVNRRGHFINTAMSADDPCPETHFRCPHPVYCMPVFLRCNGVKDCPYGEDELSCEAFVCPGHYRCRGSSVCLHPSQVCDGWPQCPQRDDELLCNASCPSVCQCQGLAFVCHRPFPAMEYPDLRYLDASGSGITPMEVSENVYLIYLRLATCELNSIPLINMKNLQYLDLSDNSIHTVHLRIFGILQNLRSVRLKGNPLNKIVSDPSVKEQKSLTVVDLSHTQLPELDSAMFAVFPSIEILNMSFSSLSTISERGLQHFPKLKKLDLSGCSVEELPRNLYAGLTQLQLIKAENYKLCCKSTLPALFDENMCFTPQDEISSCGDLLRSNFYRTFLWILGLLSLLGNTGCFMYRILRQRSSVSGFNVFVTSLSLSDVLMGVYLAIVGIADELFRGEYMWHETTWKTSVSCKLAGFLSLLSNEVSAFMICLITIDRFLVLHFPFSTFRFKGRSAVMASAVAWLAGLTLAAVPLLSAFSHWHFYGQTGICIPLPVTRKAFKGQSYSFGVMIVFNFVLFVSIALGQAFIYWSIKSNSMEAIDSGNKSRDLTVARRLITVVVSDFLCWFPIGVLGLMVFSGTPVPGEVNVAMAIFVLPLNSALNPFLYTFNMLMEKRRQAREARLLKVLETRALAEAL